MFEDEKFYNGNWWYRNDDDTDGTWYKFTYEMLLEKCNEQDKELVKLKQLVNYLLNDR